MKLDPTDPLNRVIKSSYERLAVTMQERKDKNDMLLTELDHHRLIGQQTNALDDFQILNVKRMIMLITGVNKMSMSINFEKKHVIFQLHTEYTPSQEKTDMLKLAFYRIVDQ